MEGKQHDTKGLKASQFRALELLRLENDIEGIPIPICTNLTQLR